MRYQFAVCDDRAGDGEYVLQLCRAWARQTGSEIAVEVFPSAEAFLFRYAEKKNFDVLLLDIEMKGMDGVTLARKVRQENEAVQIVFVTGYSDYIAEGYEVSALHYLMKPVKPDKFFEVLSRAVGRLGRSEPTLILEMPGETVRIPLKEIYYVDVHQNYVTVHGKQCYTVKRPLAEMEAALDERFFRIGRSCIVNLSCVQRVSRTETELTNGERIPLPRGQYEKLNQAIIQQM